MKLFGIIAFTLALSFNAFADVCNGTYKDIVGILKPMGWTVTATNGGRHNTGSRHYKGKAVDVSVKLKSEFDIIFLTDALTEQGYVVKDERVRPINQRVWTGPHLHIYVPECKAEVVIDIEDET